MRSQRTIATHKDQQVLKGRQELFDGMAVEGFTPGTQKAYSRAYDRFSAATAGDATGKDAKAYLAELKRSGASRNVYGMALRA
ncbi:MAG: hypothetical protein HQ559_06475 [Lentisphaerae bacterium]|nr:hypothetical protein [Lentisphaerota bacterium]